MLSFCLIFSNAAKSRYLSNSIFLHDTNSKDKFLNWNLSENSSSYLEDDDLSKISNFVLLVSLAYEPEKKYYLKIKLLIISSKETASILLIE